MKRQATRHTEEGRGKHGKNNGLRSLRRISLRRISLRRISPLRASIFGVACWAALSPAALLAQERREQPLRVEEVRVGKQEGKRRVVLELNRAAPYRLFMLENPERLVVDLPNADTSKFSAALKPSGFVKGYRYGLFRPQVLRFVFEFDAAVVAVAHGGLDADGRHGFRLFVDLAKVADARLRPPPLRHATKGWKDYIAAQPALWKSSAAKSAQESSRTKVAKPSVSSAPSSSTRRKRRVVLDAGHGGIDSGARAHGLEEKRVVLLFVQEIARKLRSSGRYKVFLTRDADFFVPLRQRYEIAHRLNADLFLSVHADHLRAKSVRGATVYTLSEVASDRESAELASRENNAAVLVGQDLSEFTPDVSTILIDLARKSTNRKSWRAAETFVRQLNKKIPTLKRTHRYAGFVVLKSPNVPSLLLELGYLSNPKDAHNLRQPAFRKKVAALVLKALDVYFKDAL